MAVLLQLQRVRPPVLNRVAQPVQRPYTGVAAPREHELARAAHTDELIVDQIRRHAYETQVALLLPHDLITGAEGYEMGEALHGDSGAVVNILRDSIMQRKKCSHLPISIRG